jgi:hypothetical protein
VSALQIAKGIFLALPSAPTPWRFCQRCNRVWHVSTPGCVEAELPADCDGVVKAEDCVECEERGRL